MAQMNSESNDPRYHKAPDWTFIGTLIYGMSFDASPAEHRGAIATFRIWGTLGY
jgi:hypothetical protein